jgi:glutathione synthase/RimK-type ligase-like ATP-grasp enzyme
MKKIGFLTDSAAPHLLPEERLIAAQLKKRNVEVNPVVWEAASAARAVEGLDSLIIRTPWNYLNQAATFLKWLEAVDQTGIPVWNPVPLIRWNYEKSYLADLARRGARIIPTIFTERSTQKPLSEFASALSGDHLIVKPMLSAGAHETYCVSRSDLAHFENTFKELNQRKELLIQPMMPEVSQKGEWSFLFFNGEFSHASLKQPASGDFRVQEKYGGKPTLIEHPESGLLAQAEAITKLIPHDWLYARVDGVEREGNFYLMELEVFEPQLFLFDRADLASRVADAICVRLSAQ